MFESKCGVEVVTLVLGVCEVIEECFDNCNHGVVGVCEFKQDSSFPPNAKDDPTTETFAVSIHRLLLSNLFEYVRKHI